MKIKHLYTIALVLLFTANLSAQKGRIDSLIKAVDNASKVEDKVETLLKIARTYAYLNPDSTEFYGNKALSVSKKHGYGAGECKATSIIGSSYFIRENDSVALSYYNKALKLARKLKLDKDEVAILSNIGSVYVSTKKLNKGAELLEKALEVDRRVNNTRGEAIRLNNLSTIYLMQGDYSRAAEYIFQSISIFKKDKDTTRVAMAYNNLAKLYHDQKEYEKSISYSKKAEKLLIKEKHSGLLKKIYVVLGDVYIEIGDNENGIKYLRNAIYHGNLAEGPCTIQSSLVSLSKVYIALGELDSALITTNKVLKNIDRCKNDSALLSETYYLQSEVAIERGDWKAAEDKALVAYRVLRSPKRFKTSRSSTAKLLAKIYAHKKDFEKAYIYMSIHNELNDSLINESNIKDITRLEAEHKFELEKQTIAAKNKEDALVLENKVQQQKELRNLLIVLGGIAIVLMFVFYRLSLARKKANTELQEKNSLIVEQKERIEEANNELIQLSEHKEFFTQMIAHDLKNPLNIINVFSSLEPTQQNQKHIKQASSQMFSLVNNMLDVRKYETNGFSVKKGIIPLHNIIQDAIDRCILLLQTKSITVKTRIPHNLLVEVDNNTMTRVFENLIINAAKYSASGKQIDINVLFNEEKKQAEIKVIDNGYGIDGESIPLIFDKYWQVSSEDNKVAASTGLGLAFCKLVIEEHGGEINVDSIVNKGTTFTITLPNTQLSNGDVVETADKKSEGNEILPLEYKSESEVVLSINALKSLKVFEAGKINEQLSTLEKYKVNELWKSKVLATVFSGDQKEYNKLLEAV